MSAWSVAARGGAVVIVALAAGAAATAVTAVLTDRVALVLAAGAVPEALTTWAALGWTTSLRHRRGPRLTAIAALSTAMAVATLLWRTMPPSCARSPTTGSRSGGLHPPAGSHRLHRGP